MWRVSGERGTRETDVRHLGVDGGGAGERGVLYTVELVVRGFKSPE